MAKLICEINGHTAWKEDFASITDAEEEMIIQNLLADAGTVYKVTTDSGELVTMVQHDKEPSI